MIYVSLGDREVHVEGEFQLTLLAARAERIGASICKIRWVERKCFINGDCIYIHKLCGKISINIKCWMWVYLILGNISYCSRGWVLSYKEISLTKVKGLFTHVPCNMAVNNLSIKSLFVHAKALSLHKVDSQIEFGYFQMAIRGLC